jgi:hypothetical protein
MLEKFSRLISDAPEGKSFYTDFGEIKNLKELKKCISERGSHFYFSYVSNDTNHFANWIEKIYDDKELADTLRNADSNEKVVKAIEDRVRYAELWLTYNADKEILNHYLANGEFSLKKVMNAAEFTPEHHKYESTFDIDTRSITKVSPPKTTTFIQNFTSVFQKKQPEDVPEVEVMKNAVLLPGTYKVRHKEAITEEKERAAFSYLQRIFPGVKSTAPGEKINLFEKIFSWLWK